MNVADYMVNHLIELGVTDVFGIPGAIILKFLYAVERRKGEISAHLNYHEQMSGYAAMGFAQHSGKLGVVYSTRGPGVTNLMTTMADAYFDSSSVLFISSHSHKDNTQMRCDVDQDIDFTNAISNFTKYSIQINHIEEVQAKFEKACDLALDNRKGPVFLDINVNLFDTEIIEIPRQEKINVNIVKDNTENINKIEYLIRKSKRPILMIGNGIKLSKNEDYAIRVLNKLGIPVVSSRFAIDIGSQIDQYFGYVGSHGIRYSNFILSKADLVISIGNRLSFPVESLSYKNIAKQKSFVRFEVDKNEFTREIDHSLNIQLNVKDSLSLLDNILITPAFFKDWIKTCKELKRNLQDFEIQEPVKIISTILENSNSTDSIVCDVGNNEFWTARAFEHIRPNKSIYFSKSFGTLGTSLGRAIGVHYASKSPVLCIVGDQGLQFNIQELQFISQWKLPIMVLLVNNTSSGMIRDKQIQMKKQILHTTIDTGYSVPDFEKLSLAYGINYFKWEDKMDLSIFTKYSSESNPCIVEIKIDSELKMDPTLYSGDEIQDLSPKIEKNLYDYLNNL